MLYANVLMLARTLRLPIVIRLCFVSHPSSASSLSIMPFYSLKYEDRKFIVAVVDLLVFFFEWRKKTTTIVIIVVVSFKATNIVPLLVCVRVVFFCHHIYFWLTIRTLYFSYNHLFTKWKHIHFYYKMPSKCVAFVTIEKKRWIFFCSRMFVRSI